MRKTTLDKMAMYRSVLSIVESNQAILEAYPRLVELKEAVKQKVDALDSVLEKQMSTTKGVRIVKDEFINELKVVILLLSKALYLHGKASKDVFLMERSNATKTSIDRLSMKKLQVHAEKVLLDLNTHEAALATYGVTQETIDKFRAMEQEISVKNISTRLAILERTNHTKLIADLESEIDMLLRDEMDALLLIIQANHSDVFKAYKGARKVVATKGKKIDRDEGGTLPEAS